MPFRVELFTAGMKSRHKRERKKDKITSGDFGEKVKDSPRVILKHWYDGGGLYFKLDEITKEYEIDIERETQTLLFQ